MEDLEIVSYTIGRNGDLLMVAVTMDMATVIECYPACPRKTGTFENWERLIMENAEYRKGWWTKEGARDADNKRLRSHQEEMLDLIHAKEMTIQALQDRIYDLEGGDAAADAASGIEPNPEVSGGSNAPSAGAESLGADAGKQEDE